MNYLVIFCIVVSIICLVATELWYRESVTKNEELEKAWELVGKLRIENNRLKRENILFRRELSKKE